MTVNRAALDTDASESLSPDSRMPNVLLSPHVAGQTDEAMPRVGQAVVQAILDASDGKRPAFVVSPKTYPGRGE